MSCGNNMKQLGLALHNYHDTYSVFPPGRTGTGSGTNHNSTRLSFFVGMLPYFEQQALYDDIQANNGQTGSPWNSTSYWNIDLPTLGCPSDGNLQDRDRGKTSYVGNKGDRTTQLEDWEFERGRGLFLGNRSLKMANIKDGASNTLAFSEVVQSPSYGGDNREVPGGVLQGIDVNGSGPIVCKAAVDPADKNQFLSTAGTGTHNSYLRGNRWADSKPVYTGFTAVLGPNSPSCSNGNPEDSNNIALSAYAYHPGGVQVTLVDGSVRFVAESINTGNAANLGPGPTSQDSPYGVWGAMSTRTAGETFVLP
jgi:hypothetical protein